MSPLRRMGDAGRKDKHVPLRDRHCLMTTLLKDLQFHSSLQLVEDFFSFVDVEVLQQKSRLSVPPTDTRTVVVYDKMLTFL